ncbi:M48 family metalloprotease [Glycomyces tritici]|uniref:M48 family metalloprotease n=1 Tax=Glycomyces tritici TaxID=2665176 RepID=A0ABT7YLW6_9ACTN|nr:M48 family metalloprotease [Glycomyces tritici]MDN3239580.1 M48 family metalloprotease [Glycomyces tritici]
MSGPRLAVDAATTLRFAQLVALMVVSTGATILEARNLLGGNLDRAECYRAAGVNAEIDTYANAADSLSRNADAVAACLEQYPAPSMWLAAIWIGLLLAATLLLFNAMPKWKARRGRYVPLELLPGGAAARTRIDELADALGLAGSKVVVVVDPVAATESAVMFGSNRRPRMRMHRGLLDARETEPETFDAVVLHELAHLKNRDLTITYLVIAMWRVFVWLVLVPYLIVRIDLFFDSVRFYSWATNLIGINLKNIAATGLLAVLVYLSRTEVLRVREMRADQTARSRPDVWPAAAVREDQGRWKRFLRIWRVHPDWDTRRATMERPESLQRIRPFALALTGLATVIMLYRIQFAFTEVPWPLVPSLLAAALIAAVAASAILGVYITQAVALRDAGPGTGAAAGFWFGLGMMLGLPFVDAVFSFTRLPSHPEFSLALVAMAVLFGWWLSETARQWTGTGVSAPRLAVVVALSLPVLTILLVVWRYWSAFFEGLYPFFDTDTVSSQWGDTVESKGGEADGFAARAFYLLSPALLATAGPLLFAMIALMWAAAVVPRIVPPLRRRFEPLPSGLKPAIAGAAAGLAGIAAIRLVLGRFDFTDATGPYSIQWSLYYWSSAAVLFAAAIAAAVAANTGRPRLRLLHTLVSVYLGIWAGVAGFIVVTAADGCLGPLNVYQSECAWRPDLAWPEISMPLNLLVVGSLVVAAVAAALGSAVQRLARRPERPERPAPEGRRFDRAAAPVAIALVLALALFFTGWRDRHYLDMLLTSTADPGVLEGWIEREGERPPELVAEQVRAWLDGGGYDLLERFADDLTTMDEATAAYVSTPEGERTLDQLNAVPEACDRMTATVLDADDYFEIPDTALQQIWSDFLDHTWDRAVTCADEFQSVVDGGDGEVWATAVRGLREETIPEYGTLTESIGAVL